MINLLLELVDLGYLIEHNKMEPPGHWQLVLCNLKFGLNQRIMGYTLRTVAVMSGKFS